MILYLTESFAAQAFGLHIMNAGYEFLFSVEEFLELGIEARCQGEGETKGGGNSGIFFNMDSSIYFHVFIFLPDNLLQLIWFFFSVLSEICIEE